MARVDPALGSRQYFFLSVVALSLISATAITLSLFSSDTPDNESEVVVLPHWSGESSIPPTRSTPYTAWPGTTAARRHFFTG
jgi:hypothetical protein